MYNKILMSIFQYVSDLHLEKHSKINYSKLVTPNKNNYLILAGDICPLFILPLDFLEWCRDNFKKTFYIPGNHEYWGISIESGKKLFKAICKTCGVIGLDNQYYEGEDFRILGCTLWTHIPDNFKKDIQNKISDYKHIKGHIPENTNKMHNDCVNFVNNNLSKTKKNIVVSHHGPVRELCSAPQYRGQWSNISYSADCIHLVGKCDFWVFGHTHYNVNFWVDNCEVLSNCRGYKDEKVGYIKDKSFRV